MKKVFSVALALVMILSCVSVMASAVTTNAVLEVSVVPTQNTYKKGDIVTFEVFYEESDETEGLGSPDIIGFGYDSSVFEPVEDLTTNKDGNAQNTYIVDGYPIAADYTPAMSAVRVLAGGSAKDQAKGWDMILHIGIPSKQTSIYDFKTKAAAFAFKLKVKEDADPNGSYTVGVSDQYHQAENVRIMDPYGGIYGSDTEAFGFTNSTMFSFVDATVNVATDATSIIKDGGSNIRFRGIGQNGTAADYTGEGFDVRTVATISEADFKAKFTDDATAIEKITDIGFVYAAKSKVATFDVATAKAVAQGTAAEGYVKAPVTCIQHAADGADYRFTCLIKNIPDADNTDAVSALAYVCFDGEYIFADAAIVADYTELYARMPK